MKGIRYLADVVVCNEGFFSTVAEIKSGSTTGENQNLEQRLDCGRGIRRLSYAEASGECAEEIGIVAEESEDYLMLRPVVNAEEIGIVAEES